MPPKKKQKGNDLVLIPSSSKGKQKAETSTSPSHVPSLPSTSATLHLPSGTTIANLRYERPPIPRYPEGPPSNPKFLKLLHPANNHVFFTLPAYDQLPAQLQYGVHHETVITACTILACNRPGYLSKSRTRNADRVSVPLDSILLPDRYYYHLGDNTETGELYPICDDFQNWSFPHGKIPPSWDAVPNEPSPMSAVNWTAVSDRIKSRDTICLISGYTMGLTTAHIVNKEDDIWLEKNRMDDYLSPTMPFHQSPRNLFCLRYDLHRPIFDRAWFAIVPKSGKLFVHFLRDGAEYANQFHNVVFDHKHHLSHEALYARFAWALIKIVKDSKLNSKIFNILGRKANPGRSGDGGLSETRDEDEGGGGGKGIGRGGGGGGGGIGRGRGGGGTGGGGGGGGGRGRGRDRAGDDGEDDVEGDDSDDGDDGGTYQPRGRQWDPDALTLQSDSWLHDVLHKMAPGDDQSSLKTDKREIEDDLRRAACDHPFLVDASIQPTAHNYENLLWYPGMKVVERRKQAYINSHPHIRACNGPRHHVYDRVHSSTPSS